MTLWKTLDGQQSTIAETAYRYPIGRWTKHLNPDELVVCGFGYHLARDKQVLDWLHRTLYTAEPCPNHPLIEGDNKVVTCRVRLTRVPGWDERSARLFAADCAEHVLPFFEKVRPDDDRPRKAIEAARLYANGEIGAAAWEAARAAAWDATWDATRAAAEDATRAAGAAADAAGAAAGAARDATRDATWDATWEAARAARAAADAARAAARAARAAADAAGAAARAAAGAAERDWQYRKLLEYL